MSTLRLLGVGWYFQFKMILRSPFDGIGNVLYPLFFATTALFVFRAGQSPRTLIYASLGAAVMGMWSSVSTSAGSAMQRERWWGTLELLVAAPRHFSLVMLPATLGLATVGIYNLAATLLWGRLVFGIPLTITHPLLFALSVVGTVLAFGGLGLLFAVVVRPLPRGLGARELLRVSGLADLRLPRSASAPARLGPARSRGFSRRPGV